MSEFKILELLKKYNKQDDVYQKGHILIEIDEGSDGLYGLRVTDTSNGAIWWETICETREDAVKAVSSLFETKAFLNLQKNLDRVKVK